MWTELWYCLISMMVAVAAIEIAARVICGRWEE